MKELIFASHNKGKIAEIKQILTPFGIGVKSSDEIDLIKNVYWGGKKINYLTSSRKRLHYDFKEIDYK